LEDKDQEACRDELGAVWRAYLSGDYARLEKQVFKYFAPLPSDVDKRRTCTLLEGGWLGIDIANEDLDGFKFVYPLRPDPKELGKALARVGLCTAGSGMEVLPDEDAAAAATEPEEEKYWESLRQPESPGMWRFFIDGTGPGSLTGTPPSAVLN
jgi:hypothetical protein